MPELPEVETIRRGLNQYLPGKSIADIQVHRPKQFIGDHHCLTGAIITKVDRRGKLLTLQIDKNRVLAIHLKMTGQLLYRPVVGDLVMGGHPEASYIDQLPNKYTRVIITFTDGSLLFFNDLRSFGYLHLMTNDELQQFKFLKSLGPEPLGTDFTPSYLWNQLQKAKTPPIKSFLLDQSKLAGLGNIYADESLFQARIHPLRRPATLTPAENQQLYDAIVTTLKLALQHGGSTAKDYVNAIGQKGTYLDVAKVYRKTGLDCPRCPGMKIERLKVGGRSSHFCPNCQK